MSPQMALSPNTAIAMDELVERAKLLVRQIASTSRSNREEVSSAVERFLMAEQDMASRFQSLIRRAEREIPASPTFHLEDALVSMKELRASILKAAFRAGIHKNMRF